jgi:uncharacterized protein (TIGR03067 family)
MKTQTSVLVGVITVMLAFVVQGADIKKNPSGTLGALIGTWQENSTNAKGQVVDSANLITFVITEKRLGLCIKKQRGINGMFSSATGGSQMKEETFDGVDYFVDWFEYLINTKSSPHAIDLLYQNPSLDGKTAPMRFKGIFKLEGNTLALCYSGNGEERPKAFTLDSGTLFQLTRVKKSL